MFRQTLENGQNFLHKYNGTSNLAWRTARRVAVAATATVSKLTMNHVLRPNIQNLDILTELLKMSKLDKRGLITNMNHTSVIDEPILWGILPWSLLTAKDGLRWTLGADNICFTTKLRSTFFSLGQVLATKRFGAGPFQGAIDASISLLSPYHEQPGREGRPQWVHIFPESYVHQPFPPYQHTLRYFHWGISRLILEPTVQPIIVPIYTNGLENVAPEEPGIDEKRFGSWRNKIGTEITVVVGNPIDDAVIREYRREWTELVAKYVPHSTTTTTNTTQLLPGEMPEVLQTGPEAQALRSRLALLVRDNLEQTRVASGLPESDPELGHASFWARPNNVRIAGKPSQLP